MKKNGSKNTSTDGKRGSTESNRDPSSWEPVRPGDLPRVPSFLKHLDHVYVIPSRRKRQLTIRLDADVFDWLRGLGRGYQTKLNAFLREAMLASRSRQK